MNANILEAIKGYVFLKKFVQFGVDIAKVHGMKVEKDLLLLMQDRSRKVILIGKWQ